MQKCYFEQRIRLLYFHIARHYFRYRSSLVIALLPPAIIHGVLYWGLLVVIIFIMIYGMPDLQTWSYILPYFYAVYILHGIGHAYFVASRCPTVKQQWKVWLKTWKCEENEVHPAVTEASVVQRDADKFHDHFEMLEHIWNTTKPNKKGR